MKLFVGIRSKRAFYLKRSINKQKAIIKSFGHTELYVKLLEMGCIPEEEISVELTAPLGDPIAINVAGYHLSLRNDEAENIMVEIMDTQP